MNTACLRARACSLAAAAGTRAARREAQQQMTAI